MREHHKLVVDMLVYLGYFGTSCLFDVSEYAPPVLQELWRKTWECWNLVWLGSAYTRASQSKSTQVRKSGWGRSMSASPAARMLAAEM